MHISADAVLISHYTELSGIWNDFRWKFCFLLFGNIDLIPDLSPQTRRWDKNKSRRVKSLTLSCHCWTQCQHVWYLTYLDNGTWGICLLPTDRSVFVFEWFADTRCQHSTHAAIYWDQILKWEFKPGQLLMFDNKVISGWSLVLSVDISVCSRSTCRPGDKLMYSLLIALQT